MVQTSTRPPAQRNTVLATAWPDGILVPNRAFTAGTRLAGIWRAVSSSPRRAHTAAGASAWACTSDSGANASIATTTLRGHEAVRSPGRVVQCSRGAPSGERGAAPFPVTAAPGASAAKPGSAGPLAETTRWICLVMIGSLAEREWQEHVGSRATGQIRSRYGGIAHRYGRGGTLRGHARPLGAITRSWSSCQNVATAILGCHDRRVDNGPGAMNDLLATLATFVLFCVSAGLGRYLHP